MNTFEFVQCLKKMKFLVSSMSNLVNLVKALLGSVFDRSKPKIGCFISITIGDSPIDEHIRVGSMFEK